MPSIKITHINGEGYDSLIIWFYDKQCVAKYSRHGFMHLLYIASFSRCKLIADLAPRTFRKDPHSAGVYMGHATTLTYVQQHDFPIHGR